MSSVEQLFNIQMEDLPSIAMIRMRRSFIHVNLNFNASIPNLLNFAPRLAKYAVQQLKSMLHWFLTLLGDLERTLGWEYWKLKVMYCYFRLLQRSLYMYLLFIYRVLELSTILSITKSITNTSIYLEYSTKF